MWNVCCCWSFIITPLLLFLEINRTTVSFNLHNAILQGKSYVQLVKIYAPNFGDIEEACWFGPVYPLRFLETKKLKIRWFLDLEIWLVAYIWKVSGSVFFSPPVLSFMSYYPFSYIGILHRNKFVKISEEPINIGSLKVAYRFQLRCRWTD